jgi:hypothetical protein
MPFDLPIRAVSFAGHESFALRFAWLRKGYDAIAGEPAFFGADDAMTRLGTGKNMVRAVRHWGLACGVWSEVEGSRGREVEPTEFGHRLLAPDGWDPFLEETGSLWALHARLATCLDRATSITWAFSRPAGDRFHRDELVAELESLARAHDARRTPSGTIRRDVEVFIRMYLRTRAGSDGYGEDVLDSPFVQLGLMRPGPDRGSCEFVTGEHLTLPDAVFEAALIDYLLHLRATSAGVITVDELLYAPMSPGRIFRLSDRALTSRLARIAHARAERWRFDETAGLRQLYVATTLAERDDLAVLDAHYAAGRSLFASGAA